MRSCETASEFPKNIVYHDTYDHILEGYFNRLNEQEDRLFCDVSKAKLTIMELAASTDLKCLFISHLHSREIIHKAAGFENITLFNYNDLRDYFDENGNYGKTDPSCRIM